MNKTQRAIIETYAKGYRATENGDIISPKGVVRKPKIVGVRRSLYKTINVSLDGKSFSN